MNDRFRFRAWDKKNKNFIFDIENENKRDWEITELEQCRYFGEYFLMPERYIVEQCTGLKDKNGRPIYEGDIISIFGGSQYEIVEWCEGRLGYFVEVQLSAGADFGPECLGNLRDVIAVIGNIHENADLLEEKSEKPIF